MRNTFYRYTNIFVNRLDLSEKKVLDLVLLWNFMRLSRQNCNDVLSAFGFVTTIKSSSSTWTSPLVYVACWFQRQNPPPQNPP